MKKTIALLLAVVCLFTAVSASAAVAAIPSAGNTPTAKLATTKAFIDELNDGGLTFELLNDYEDGHEVVVINSSESYGDVSFWYTFAADETLVTLRVWDIITFDESDRAAVLDVCNELNFTYRFAKFVVDDENRAVFGQIDSYVTAELAGDICVEDLLNMHNILKEACPLLDPYQK